MPSARVLSSDTADVCATCSVLTEDVIIVFPKKIRVLCIVIVMY